MVLEIMPPMNIIVGLVGSRVEVYYSNVVVIVGGRRSVGRVSRSGNFTINTTRERVHRERKRK